MVSNGKTQKSIQSENFHYSELEIILLPYLCKVIPEKVLYPSLANPMIITLQQQHLHVNLNLIFNFFS